MPAVDELDVLQEMNTSPRAFRIVTYVALVMSIAVLVLCFPFIGPHNGLDFARAWFPQIAAGYAVMILTIEVVGIPLRVKLTSFWAAGFFTFTLFMVGMVGAAATLIFVYQDDDPIPAISVTLFRFGMYGFIPQLIIGFVGAAALRFTSKKTGEQDAPSNR